ncbi:hypothetical protein GWK47_017188 [Chionoecetes opilio]|uniref:Uncharacterized protein n=1 Tax=Chionoecetes opilio TaxID=41210 RepID=A0A8J5CM67_CHIOP|nr:hypothetical protein GWK47_017188 [Chionoecetes opilio]
MARSPHVCLVPKRKDNGHQGAIWKVPWHFVPEDRCHLRSLRSRWLRPLYDLLVTYDSPTHDRTARWLTTAQPARVQGGPEAWTDWQRTNTLEILVKYCLQVYFKLLYDTRVQPQTRGRPKHILTQLRVMRSQPKGPNSCDLLRADRSMVRHSECVLPSLMASQSEDDRRFAVTQILKLRAARSMGDTSVKGLHHTQAELVSHQLADTDQLAAWPGARAGIHLVHCPGTDPGDPRSSRTRFRSSLSTHRAPKES